MSAYINIVGGPSKFDLMTAVFLRGPARPKVTLKPAHGSEYTATITGVRDARFGTDETDAWSIHGFLHDIFVVGGKDHGGAARKVNLQEFEGSYDTATRKGWIKFIEPYVTPTPYA